MLRTSANSLHRLNLYRDTKWNSIRLYRSALTRLPAWFGLGLESLALFWNVWKP